MPTTRKRKTKEPEEEPEEDPIVPKRSRRQAAKRKTITPPEPDSPQPVTKKRATRATRVKASASSKKKASTKKVATPAKRTTRRSSRSKAPSVKKTSVKKASVKKRTTRRSTAAAKKVATPPRSISKKKSTKKKSTKKKAASPVVKRAPSPAPTRRSVRSRRSTAVPEVYEADVGVDPYAGFTPASTTRRRRSTRAPVAVESPGVSPSKPVSVKKSSSKKKKSSKKVRTPAVTNTPASGSRRKIAAKTPAPSKGMLERKPRSATKNNVVTESTTATSAAVEPVPLSIGTWFTFLVCQLATLYGALMTGSLALRTEISVVQQLLLLIGLQVIAMVALARTNMGTTSGACVTLIATEFIYFVFFSWDYLISFNLDYIEASTETHSAPRTVITLFSLAFIVSDILVQGGRHVFPEMLRNLLHVSFLGWLILVPAQDTDVELRRNLFMAYMLVVQVQFSSAMQSFHAASGYVNLAAIFGYVSQLVILMGIPYMSFLMFSQSDAHVNSLLTLGYLATDGFLFTLSNAAKAKKK